MQRRIIKWSVSQASVVEPFGTSEKLSLVVAHFWYNAIIVVFFWHFDYLVISGLFNNFGTATKYILTTKSAEILFRSFQRQHLLTFNLLRRKYYARKIQLISKYCLKKFAFINWLHKLIWRPLGFSRLPTNVTSKAFKTTKEIYCTGFPFRSVQFREIFVYDSVTND